MISKEQYLRLMDAVWNVNGLSAPEDGEPIVMFNYAGHCNVIEVRIFENGWYPNAEPNFTKRFRVGKEDANEEIEDAIESLKQLAEANKEFHLRMAMKCERKVDFMAELDAVQEHFMDVLDEFRRKMESYE